MALHPGDIVQEKYRIVRLIGQGGMGEVWEGENTLIRRRVAIKVLHGNAAANPEVLQRFQREAQAAGRIGNDHIMEVLDLGTLADGDKYLVMEYLDGEPLSARIKQLGRMTPAEVAPLATQILAGLGAAHEAGIIHRDLKPDNIFILKSKAGQANFVKLIDFGISKFSAMGDEGMKMTATGAFMGTPYYMSPEQANGSSKVDLRSDIYAVGVILYEAVTGALPFSGESFNQLMFQIVLSDLVPPREVVPELDPAFDTIIRKAMAREPDHRFASAAAMKTALDEWLRSGASVSVPPPAEADPKIRAGVLKAAPSPVQRTTTAEWASSQTGIPQSSGRTPIVAGTVAGILLLVAVVAFFLVRGSGEPSAASTSPAHAPSAQAAPGGKEPPAPEAPPAEAKPGPDVTPSAPVASAEAAPGKPVNTPSVATRAGSKVARPAPPVKTGAEPKPKKPSGAVDYGY